MSEIDRLMPRPNYRKKLINATGDTQDIVNCILDLYQKSRRQTKPFARLMQRNTLAATAQSIWNLIKTQIKYQEDDFGIQDIKTPARLWADKVGDCKSYAIFTASILYNLGLPFAFRFVSFSDKKIWTHVYIILLAGNNRYIPIDAVWHTYNQEKKYTYKLDIKPN